MFELVEVKTGRIIERYDYDFDEFIKTKYGGFFSLIMDDAFTPGDVMPEFAWRRSKTTELAGIPIERRKCDKRIGNVSIKEILEAERRVERR